MIGNSFVYVRLAARNVPGHCIALFRRGMIGLGFLETVGLLEADTHSDQPPCASGYKWALQAGANWRMSFNYTCIKLRRTTI